MEGEVSSFFENTIAILVDISPNYKPSEVMLSGEPYLINYLKNFDKFMEKEEFRNIELINNHVRIWYY